MAQYGSIDISRTHRAVLDIHPMSQDLFQHLDQLVQGNFLVGRDVQGGTACIPHSQAHGPGDISGIDEIPGLVPVPENGHRLLLGDLPGKDGNHPSFSSFPLPFPVHIGETENHMVQTESLAVEPDIAFSHGFGKAVEGSRSRHFRFPEGQVLVVSVNGGTGRKDDLFHPAFPAAFQKMHQSGHIQVLIGFRMFHGIGHQGLGRQMDHRLELFLCQEVLQFPGTDIQQPKRDSCRHIRPFPSGQIVQYGHFTVFPAQKSRHHMGTDEASSPCH